MATAAQAEAWVFGAPVAPAAQPAAPVRLWNARHGVPIAALAATEDGSAAVTIDESNHARLWPALDGTREPWVLPLTTPIEAAVVHDADGFAVAARDEAGGAEFMTVTNDGDLIAHVKLPPEPGFDAVIADRGGFLAVRRDQTLVHFDRRGDATATLVPAPGEHVMKLVARSGRTLALVRTADGVRGHWLAGDRLAWGDATPKLKVDLARVYLSPDHKRLVSARLSSEVGPQTFVIDLDSGRSREVVNAMNGNPPNGVPIGFAADQRIVTAFSDFELSTLEWWKASGMTNATLGGSSYALEGVTLDRAVVTDAGVISFAGQELAIARPNTASSPSAVRFLGYRTTRVKALRSSPLGPIGTIGRVARLLDERVQFATRMPALDAIPLAKDLALIRFTAQDWGEPVVNVSNGIDPEWLETAAPVARQSSTPRVALFDLETKQELQRWPTARAIRFEPATQLMAIVRGSKITFARFDAAARKLVDERTLTAPVTDLALLDPALAGGAVALLVRAHGTTIEVRTLGNVAAEPTVALPAPATLTGRLDAIDRAGRVYVRADADTVVVHAGDREVARIPGMTGWTLRPSPSGDRIAAFAKSRLMLLDDHGVPLWSAGFPGITDATWTPDGGLVALAGDLAALDPASGRVIAAQCGWGFALRSERPEIVDVPSTTETLCDR